MTEELGRQFTIPEADDDEGPWPMFERLLVSHEELAELASLLDQNVTVAFAMRWGGWIKGDREILGTCYMPGAQGALKSFFEFLLEDRLGYMPGFLIILNGDWWMANTKATREILLFHELMHAGQKTDKHGSPAVNMSTGEPILAIRSHDIEEFRVVVQRYGAWSPDVVAFRAALDAYDGPTGVPRYEPEPLEPEDRVF